MHRTIEINKTIDKNSEKQAKEPKKKLKISILLFFVLFSFSFLTGCASVNYLEYSALDGSYYLSVGVEFEVEKINGGISVNSMKEEVSKILISSANEMNMLYEKGLMTAMLNQEITEQNYFDLAEAFIADVDLEQATTNFLSLYLLVVPIQSGDRVFSAQEIINIYSYESLVAPPSDNPDNSPTLTTNFLVQILEQTINSPYSSDDIQAYANYFLNNLQYSADGYSLNDVSFSYSYGSDYRRLHSNADVIEKVDGVYYHTWNFEQDENGMLLDKEMKIYRNYANMVNWYLLGLVFAVLCVGVVTLILFLRKKKKN